MLPHRGEAVRFGISHSIIILAVQCQHLYHALSPYPFMYLFTPWFNCPKLFECKSIQKGTHPFAVSKRKTRNITKNMGFDVRTSPRLNLLAQCSRDSNLAECRRGADHYECRERHSFETRKMKATFPPCIVQRERCEKLSLWIRHAR